MVLPSYLLVIFFFLFLLDDQVLAVASSASGGECPPFFECGNLGRLRFPLSTPQNKHCGMLQIHGCEDEHPNAEKSVYLGKKMFQVMSIDYSFKTVVFVRDTDLEKNLGNQRCDSLSWNITTSPPTSPLGSFYIFPNITLYRCNSSLSYNKSLPKQFLNYTGCGKSNNETIFFRSQDQDDLPPSLATCPMVQVPVNTMAFSPDPFTFIASVFQINILLSDDCSRCSDHNQGICLLNGTGGFYCSEFKGEIEYQNERRTAWKLRLIIGGAIGSVGMIIIGSIVFLLQLKRRHKSLGSQNQSRSIEYDNTHKYAILESRNIYFGILVFSYEELKEATNEFDQSRQLGRGGFGTVYYGKLKDGREVAVKRLFERDCKGVQQFINEVQILTCLRHKNLVSLYGCTSHASRELLLVYEYISNGTLGCHLYGNQAKSGSLPWPMRMRIAIETANALSYLHASGIIHRDVKSNNLLLDHHFVVKVADFGISRLFPKLVSHVSTAPAGSPGYLDPEYYRFCQLTEKSDVYSFGVVLIELISSKPAIFTRATERINLADMAVKKIQRGAFTELVDPSLGFELDDKVREMIILVAKLAFWCLQRDVELRPSTDEVKEFLQKIENGNHDLKYLEFHGVGFPNREICTSLPTSVDKYGDTSLNSSEPEYAHRTV